MRSIVSLGIALLAFGAQGTPPPPASASQEKLPTDERSLSEWIARACKSSGLEVATVKSAGLPLDAGNVLGVVFLPKDLSKASARAVRVVSKTAGFTGPTELSADETKLPIQVRLFWKDGTTQYEAEGGESATPRFASAIEAVRAGIADRRAKEGASAALCFTIDASGEAPMRDVASAFAAIRAEAKSEEVGLSFGAGGERPKPLDVLLPTIPTDSSADPTKPGAGAPPSETIHGDVLLVADGGLQYQKLRMVIEGCAARNIGRLSLVVRGQDGTLTKLCAWLPSDTPLRAGK